MEVSEFLEESSTESCNDSNGASPTSSLTSPGQALRPGSNKWDNSAMGITVPKDPYHSNAQRLSAGPTATGVSKMADAAGVVTSAVRITDLMVSPPDRGNLTSLLRTGSWPAHLEPAGTSSTASPGRASMPANTLANDTTLPKDSNSSKLHAVESTAACKSSGSDLFSTLEAELAEIERRYIAAATHPSTTGRRPSPMRYRLGSPASSSLKSSSGGGAASSMSVQTASACGPPTEPASTPAASAAAAATKVACAVPFDVHPGPSDVLAPVCELPSSPATHFSATHRVGHAEPILQPLRPQPSAGPHAAEPPAALWKTLGAADAPPGSVAASPLAATRASPHPTVRNSTPPSAGALHPTDAPPAGGTKTLVPQAPRGSPPGAAALVTADHSPTDAPAPAALPAALALLGRPLPEGPTIAQRSEALGSVLSRLHGSPHSHPPANAVLLVQAQLRGSDNSGCGSGGGDSSCCGPADTAASPSHPGDDGSVHSHSAYCGSGYGGGSAGGTVGDAVTTETGSSLGGGSTAVAATACEQAAPQALPGGMASAAAALSQLHAQSPSQGAVAPLSPHPPGQHVGAARSLLALLESYAADTIAGRQASGIVREPLLPNMRPGLPTAGSLGPGAQGPRARGHEHAAQSSVSSDGQQLGGGDQSGAFPAAWLHEAAAVAPLTLCARPSGPWDAAEEGSNGASGGLSGASVGSTAGSSRGGGGGSDGIRTDAGGSSAAVPRGWATEKWAQDTGSHVDGDPSSTSNAFASAAGSTNRSITGLSSTGGVPRDSSWVSGGALSSESEASFTRPVGRARGQLQQPASEAAPQFTAMLLRLHDKQQTTTPMAAATRAAVVGRPAESLPSLAQGSAAAGGVQTNVCIAGSDERQRGSALEGGSEQRGHLQAATPAAGSRRLGDQEACWLEQQQQRRQQLRDQAQASLAQGDPRLPQRRQQRESGQPEALSQHQARQQQHSQRQQPGQGHGHVDADILLLNLAERLKFYETFYSCGLTHEDQGQEKATAAGGGSSSARSTLSAASGPPPQHDRGKATTTGNGVLRTPGPPLPPPPPPPRPTQPSSLTFAGDLASSAPTAAAGGGGGFIPNDTRAMAPAEESEEESEAEAEQQLAAEVTRAEAEALALLEALEHEVEQSAGTGDLDDSGLGFGFNLGLHRGGGLGLDRSEAGDRDVWVERIQEVDRRLGHLDLDSWGLRPELRLRSPPASALPGGGGEGRSLSEELLRAARQAALQALQARLSDVQARHNARWRRRRATRASASAASAAASISPLRSRASLPAKPAVPLPPPPPPPPPRARGPSPGDSASVRSSASASTTANAGSGHPSKSLRHILAQMTTPAPASCTASEANATAGKGPVFCSRSDRIAPSSPALSQLQRPTSALGGGAGALEGGSASRPGGPLAPLPSMMPPGSAAPQSLPWLLSPQPVRYGKVAPAATPASMLRPDVRRRTDIDNIRTPWEVALEGAARPWPLSSVPAATSAGCNHRAGLPESLQPLALADPPYRAVAGPFPVAPACTPAAPSPGARLAPAASSLLSPQPVPRPQPPSSWALHRTYSFEPHRSLVQGPPFVAVPPSSSLSSTVTQAPSSPMPARSASAASALGSLPSFSLIDSAPLPSSSKVASVVASATDGSARLRLQAMGTERTASSVLPLPNSRKELDELRALCSLARTLPQLDALQRVQLWERLEQFLAHKLARSPRSRSGGRDGRRGRTLSPEGGGARRGPSGRITRRDDSPLRGYAAVWESKQRNYSGGSGVGRQGQGPCLSARDRIGGEGQVGWAGSSPQGQEGASVGASGLLQLLLSPCHGGAVRGGGGGVIGATGGGPVRKPGALLDSTLEVVHRVIAPNATLAHAMSLNWQAARSHAARLEAGAGVQR